MDNFENPGTETTDINTPASNLFDGQDHFTDATLGQRFLNFLIDNLFMNYGLSMASGYALGIILAYTFPEFINAVITEGENSFSYWVLVFIIGYFNYIIYYTICEKAFKGYTLGKLITGTRAIRTDGAELTIRDAFLRTVSRLVPFEALSALGRKPWHDSWTNTRVIKSR